MYTKKPHAGTPPTPSLIGLLLLGRRQTAAKLGRLQANGLPDELVETVQIITAAVLSVRPLFCVALFFSGQRRLSTRFRAAL